MQLMHMLLQVIFMNIEEELIKNKMELKFCKARIDALIRILSREGVLTEEEVESETKDIVKENQD